MVERQPSRFIRAGHLTHLAPTDRLGHRNDPLRTPRTQIASCLTLLRPPFVNRRGVPNLRALIPRMNEGARIEIAEALTSVCFASGAHETVHLKRRVAVKHVVHRPGELRRENSQRLRLAVLPHQPRVELLPFGVRPQEKRRGFRKPPLQVVVALLPSSRALLLAVRCLLALDQPAVRQEPAERIESVDVSV